MDWREEYAAPAVAESAEVDRLRRVLGDCWSVLKGADALTHDELCDELEVVLGGLPAAHERRAANQRDRLAHALREIGRLGGMVAHDLRGRVDGGKVAAVERMATIARDALAEVER